MRSVRLTLLPAAALTVLATSLPAATLILGADPIQNYTFIRTDGGTSVTVPVAPYPGQIGSLVTGIICMDYHKGATWNTTYQGTIHAPTTAVELESAYLAGVLAGEFGHVPLSTYGAVSMAIWQLNDPTPGSVPRDAAAQPLIATAQSLYAQGKLTTAAFSNTKIWVPTNSSIQRFITVTPGTPPAEVPEPGTYALLISGLALVAVGSYKRKTEPNARR